MKYRVYLAASTQDKNIGVNQYGTEQDNMQLLADRIGLWLKTQKKFTIFRNKPGWSLKQTIDDCNNLSCDLFLDNHSNAGPPKAAGTRIYYTSSGGKHISEILLKHIGPVSPGPDMAPLHDSTLYTNGLYVLRKTKPIAALLEHFFHTNNVEVIHFIKHIDDYAENTAKGICEFFNVKWEQPQYFKLDVDAIINKLVAIDVTTSREYWKLVLEGKKKANPEFLQILISRLLNKL